MKGRNDPRCRWGCSQHCTVLESPVTAPAGWDYSPFRQTDHRGNLKLIVSFPDSAWCRALPPFPQVFVRSNISVWPHFCASVVSAQPKLAARIPRRGAAASLGSQVSSRGRGRPAALRAFSPHTPGLCLARPGADGGGRDELGASPAGEQGWPGAAEPRPPAGSSPPDSRDTCHICGRGALVPAFVPARGPALPGEAPAAAAALRGPRRPPGAKARVGSAGSRAGGRGAGAGGGAAGGKRGAGEEGRGRGGALTRAGGRGARRSRPCRQCWRQVLGAGAGASSLSSSSSIV